ncbi:hypothetical protein [Brumimicrobium mesophilum]|uniref:hypothetical protein n=1 Tax=Brumimicrobium mesophilum TaxID=392717 RepID=UPI000D140CA8|nr:hypothetical protein [Brumimicrobium mesophilum]
MKKIILLFALTFLLYSCVLVTLPSRIIRNKVWTKKADVVNVVQQDTIPFEIIGNWAVVETIVAGNKRKYVIDTGAPTVLGYSDAFVDRVIVKPEIYKPIYAENKQTYFASNAKIDTVIIGANKYSNVGAGIIDFKLFSNFMTCEDINGIIGVNIMKKGVWSFDYNKSQVIVSPTIEDLNLDNSYVFDLLDVKGFEDPIIRLNVEGQSLVTLIDTGNSGFCTFFNDKITDNFDGQKVKLSHASFKLIGEDVLVDKQLYSDSSIILNLKTNDFGDNYKFTAMNTNITSSKTYKKLDMLMGHDFLKEFITTFDWANNKVYFQPIQVPNLSGRKTSKNFNINFHVYDKKVYVFNYLNDYFPNGAINIGDTVKAINNIPIEEIVNQENYCEIVSGERDFYPKQDTTIITVKNKLGETRDLKMYEVKVFD